MAEQTIEISSPESKVKSRLRNRRSIKKPERFISALEAESKMIKKEMLSADNCKMAIADEPHQAIATEEPMPSTSLQGVVYLKRKANLPEAAGTKNSPGKVCHCVVKPQLPQAPKLKIRMKKVYKVTILHKYRKTNTRYRYGEILTGRELKNNEKAFSELNKDENCNSLFKIVKVKEHFN